MFPHFLPPGVQQLTEGSARAIAQSIQRQAIKTSLSQHPIETAYIHQGEGGTPMLLLHGFDSSVLEFHRLLPLLATQQETWAIDLTG
jgi:pimeloyl-ACP methyl ester carboxylesterase